MHHFCNRCMNEHPDPDKEPKCEIITRSMGFDIDDPEYPTEWIYDEDGDPTCTAFKDWDWGDDYDGYNEPPPPPEPDNPNQLVLPFIFEEIENNISEKTKQQAPELINTPM